MFILEDDDSFYYKFTFCVLETPEWFFITFCFVLISKLKEIFGLKIMFLKVVNNQTLLISDYITVPLRFEVSK